MLQNVGLSSSICMCISFSVGELQHNNYYHKRQDELLCKVGTFHISCSLQSLCRPEG